MEIYVVRAGDTLAGIARRYGQSAQALAHVNQLGDPTRLSVGLALAIPDADETPCGAPIEVCACAAAAVPGAALAELSPYLTFLSPPCCRISAEGELCGGDDAALISAAHDARAAPLITLANTRADGAFSGELAHALFTDAAVQDIFFESLLRELSEKRYFGAIFNFQYVFPFDRESYNRFLARAAEVLHGHGFYLVTSVAPADGSGRGELLCAAHDQAAHGELADRVIIAAYDWGHTYSAPRALSPVDRIRRALDYALAKLPSGKALLGFSCFARSWTLPWGQGDAASSFSSAAAVNLAVSQSAEIKFDRGAQAPSFSYTDAAARRHMVWFEDVRSARARLKLVSEYALAGISLRGISRISRPALAALRSMYCTEKLL